jgi:1-acyl-sn-glycerol-3-phosphate acyltransferase
MADVPCLFIGNHSLFALDGLILTPLMLEEFDRFLRPLGDKFLFTNDALAQYLVRRGASMGHPAICDALMENGQDILVFPGGAHEAVKPASAMYELQWKERYGFVKLAAKHGYTIQPFGLVGPDEFYAHLLEGEDLPESALGQLLKRFGLLHDDTRADMLPPIPSGALGSLIPKPQRCYLGFGEPVDLSDYQGKKLSQKRLHALRSEVAEQIEQQIAELLLLREQNRGEDGLLRRLLSL